MKIDITQVPLDDPKVWDLICSGNVKGCFQIESSLGRTWCKKVLPRNISELSDLISLIRPGVLKFVFDGKSMAQHYVDRKAGLDEPIPLHPALHHILIDTQQIILYQEQIIRISQEIAGFSEAEGDSLRKGIGKKDAELLLSLETRFVEGCVKVGKVSEDDAKLIFANIKKSARYLFNKSHGISYAYIAYWSAYLKCYKPLEFYRNWLREAEEKIDPDKEVKELIFAAKKDGIAVNGPNIIHLNEKFEIFDGQIYFGITNVKNIGKQECLKLKEYLKPEYMENWNLLLIHCLVNVNKRAIDNLIYVGGIDTYKFKRSRLQMIHELSCIRDLTTTELKWLQSNFDIRNSLEHNIRRLSKTRKDGGGAFTEKRSQAIQDIIKRLLDPGRSLYDDASVISKLERTLLGCEISRNELESCADADFANTTCAQYNDKNHPKQVVIACTIKSFREILTKTKEKMCFLTVEDDTAELENIVVFPKIYEEYGEIIYEDSTILLSGARSYKGDNAFIVEGLEQI